MNARRSLLWRLLVRGALVSRARFATTVLALAVAAATLAAALTLFTDVEAKLRSEFRSFGPNLVLTAAPGSFFPADAADRIQREIPGASAVPYAYAAIRAADGSTLVLAGTDLYRARSVNSWWSATAWPEQTGQLLLGRKAAAALGASAVQLQYGDSRWTATPAGILSTGGDEESRVYAALEDFTRWTGHHATVMEVAVGSTAEQFTFAQKRLAALFPSAELRPVRQIVEAEAHVLRRASSVTYAAVALIAVTVSLGVLATLMASALERRKDFALMQALGASALKLRIIFVAEAVLAASLAAFAGYIVGTAAAALIARWNFSSTLVPRASVLPVVYVATVALAVLASLAPFRALASAHPAAVLKGD